MFFLTAQFGNVQVCMLYVCSLCSYDKRECRVSLSYKRYCLCLCECALGAHLLLVYIERMLPRMCFTRAGIRVGYIQTVNERPAREVGERPEMRFRRLNLLYGNPRNYQVVQRTYYRHFSQVLQWEKYFGQIFICRQKKRVTFDPHPVVHKMHTWCFAYNNARKSDYEQFARDGYPFQNRIRQLDEIISPIWRKNLRNTN